MLRLCPILGLLVLSSLGAHGAAAEVPDHAIVPALEREELFRPDQQVEAGRLLLNELQCLACHAAPREQFAGFPPREAPDLTELASRARLEQVRRFLLDPQGVKPGTTMPQLSLGNSDERAKRVEALIHFLASSNTAALSEQLPDRAAAKRGEQLFHEVGCAVCHGSRRADAKPTTASVPLGDLEAKCSVVSLARFLLDPLAVRHSGRMPAMNLKDQEARDLANYLLVGISTTPNVAYEYYEGEWESLPDFSELKPVASGMAVGFDIGVARRKSNYALRFEGIVHLPSAAAYRFYLGSDDGARLTIDGREVALTDGVHSYSELESDKFPLSAGPHPIVVEYFNAEGDQELSVEVLGGKDLPRQGVAGLVTQSAEPPPAAKPFIADQQLADEGRRWFAATGCAACHTLERSGQRIASELPAPPLAKLNVDRGCLAKERGANVPRFVLSGKQRAAIIEAINAARNPTGAIPVETVIARTLASFNCYACHERDKRGGVEQARNELFVTTAREMGDEARIPPHLNGVGGKLTEKWLKQVLSKGAKDRPYMLTRMPQFGADNVGHLASLLTATDKLPPVERPHFDLPEYRIKSDGRHLVGGKAFSCIKCHNFGKFQGEGIQAMDMTKMTSRLRPEWFHRYLRDPPAFRPGTRMPAAWPKQGKSFLRNVLDGDTNKQIEAVWEYLRDGSDAAPPFGVGGQPIELVPESEPIVYRNFLEGVGPRGIAVGYPEKLSVAYDIDHLQLVLAWRGAFIDAARHWAARGSGFENPLGDHPLPLAKGVPLAVLSSTKQAWPTESGKTLGYQFLGYRLDGQRRPTFRYTFRQLAIEDHPTPIVEHEQPRIERRMAILGTPPSDPLYFRAVLAKKIEPSDGGFRIDGNWKIRLGGSGSGQPLVRAVGKLRELIVPIHFTGDRAEIVEVIEW